MSAPGVQTITRDSPPAQSAPTDTGPWFTAGLTERGPTGPVEITSLNRYTSIFGDFVSYGYLYDAAETYFEDGGSSMVISRVVGPTPVAASHTLQDSVPTNCLIVSANSVGEWGNALNIAVLAGDAGGEFKLQVSHDTDGILETSPSLADQAAAFAWAASSQWITLAPTTSGNDPAVISAQSLTSGADDQSDITDAQWKAALTAIGPDWGPGQVSMVGRTTTQAHTDTLAHAAANNRVAILDLPDTPTVSTLVAALAAQTANVESGMWFAPWAVVPGRSGITGSTTRKLPYSCVQAGIISRNDGDGISPNMPSAGDLGISRYAIGLSQPPWTEGDGGQRDILNAAGVNVARVMFGTVRTYGYRTGADPNTDPDHVGGNNARLDMAIRADGAAILEHYVFSQLDGQGLTLARVAGDLETMLQGWYQLGSLYGDTPADAYAVDVGPDVNTPTTIANRELHAAVSIRRSPMAEMVVLELVIRAITEGVV